MNCHFKRTAGKIGESGDCPYEFPKCRERLKYPCPYEDKYFDLAMEAQEIMKEEEHDD